MKSWHGFGAVWLLAAACGQAPAPSADEWDGLSVTGPWTHENLSVFLIRKKGASREDLNLMTLEEALEARVLSLTEKEGGAEVGELRVENTGDRPVFLQAGDTVKGGKQDRTIAQDTLILPRSGAVAVRTFCVEPGRWSVRGGGSNDFRGNDVPVATKEQRLALQLEANQERVWESGSKAIQALSPGNDSYVLASQDGQLRERMRPFLEALEPLLKGKEEVVGMAYALNGKVHSAEVYGTAGLLQKFWPKLVKRSVLEALAEKGSSGEGVATVPDVERFLRATAQAPESKESTGTGLERSVRKSAGSVRFDARWGSTRICSKLD